MTNIEVFMQTLPVMGMGMLGIFIVTAIVVLCIKALNAATRDKDE